MGWVSDFIDGTISTLAPSWGLERATSRLALLETKRLEKLALYSDAVSNPIDPPITGRGVSPDYALELGRDRRSMVDRVNTLVRDNALARALLDRCTDAVVGSGFRYQAKTDDKQWNARAEGLVEEWCQEKRACDDRELVNFDKMFALSFKGKMRDGESGFVKLKRTKGDRLGGRLRAFESADLGTPEAYYKPSAVDGLELDDDMRPKTFHIFKLDPNVLWADRRIAGLRLHVPAKDVVFQARRDSVGQTRGITAFLGGFEPLEQLRGSVQSITVGLRMAACVGLVITRQTASQAPAMPNPNSSSGQSRTLNFSPGQSHFLQPGEGMSPITPAWPTFDAQQFFKFLARWASFAFGITVEQAMGDFSDNNFSNTKANILHAWATLGILQHETKVDAYWPIIEWKLAEFMAMGLLKEREDWRKHRVRVPGQLWIDPVDDIQAAMARIAAGLDTRADVAAKHGRDLEEDLIQLQHEEKLFEQYGLTQVHSTLTRDALEVIQNARDPRGGGSGQDKGKKAKETKGTMRAVRASIARDLAVRNQNRLLKRAL